MGKIYLSGPISNNPNAPALFARAEDYYASYGYEVINPLTINPDNPSWHQAMRRDIAALMQCSTIVMLPGWKLSAGAILEHHIATKLGFEIVYHDNRKEVINDILSAIYSITGICYEQLRSASRKRDYVDARRIYAKAAKELTNYTYTELGNIINRDHSTIIYLIKSCNDLLLTDNRFSEVYNSTINYLNFYLI